MADQAHFRQALMRIGLNNHSARAFMAEDYRSPESLVDLTPEGVDKLCTAVVKKAARDAQAAHLAPAAQAAAAQVSIPFRFRKRLQAVAWKIRREKRLGLVVPPATITQVWADAIIKLMEAEASIKEALAEVDDPTPMKSVDEWPIFETAVTAWAAKQRGASDAPLSYVIRAEAIPAAGAADQPYETEAARLEALMPHNGLEWNVDNHAFFDMLCTATTESSVATAKLTKFKTSRNGRQAWLAMCEQFNGTAAFTRRKAIAEHLINTSVYTGNNPRIQSLDKVTARMQQGLLELEHPAINEGYTEPKKITTLLKQVTAPWLKESKTVVRMDPTRYNTFETCANHLISEDSVLKPKGREVSLIDTQKNGKGKRGRGKGKNKNNKKPKNGSNGWIPHKEWAKMDAEAKLAHQARWRAQKELGDRKIASIVAEQVKDCLDEMFEDDESKQKKSEDKGDKGGNAGNSFGRAAYNKKN